MTNIHLNPLRIFLLEDNPSDVDLTRLALEENQMSFYLEVANDGEEAVAYLTQLNEARLTQPDLIILDLNVPKINGLDVLKYIKSCPYTKLTPVIILTTSEAKADMVDCYHNYANCYIIKPLDFEEFIEVIREIKAFWFSIAKIPNEVHARYSTH